MRRAERIGLRGVRAAPRSGPVGCRVQPPADVSSGRDTCWPAEAARGRRRRRHGEMGEAGVLGHRDVPRFAGRSARLVSTRGTAGPPHRASGPSRLGGGCGARVLARFSAGERRVGLHPNPPHLTPGRSSESATYLLGSQPVRGSHTYLPAVGECSCRGARTRLPAGPPVGEEPAGRPRQSPARSRQLESVGQRGLGPPFYLSPPAQSRLPLAQPMTATLEKRL